MLGKSYKVNLVKAEEEKIIYIIEGNKDDLTNNCEKSINEFKEILNNNYGIKLKAGLSKINEDLLSMNITYKEVMNNLDGNKANDGDGYISLVVRKTKEYIEKNYKNNITLKQVSDLNNVSTYYLSILFAKEVGKSFIDYLNEIRIDKAKNLLLDDYRTYEVADLVGIKDSHYFSKIFKKYVGMTPSEYRESNIEKV